MYREQIRINNCLKTFSKSKRAHILALPNRVKTKNKQISAFLRWATLLKFSSLIYGREGRFSFNSGGTIFNTWTVWGWGSEVCTFPKVISSKAIVIAQLEFEFAYYVTETPPSIDGT